MTPRRRVFPSREAVENALRRYGWTESSTGCWEFDGPTPTNRYGQLSIGGRPYSAHRAAYYLWVGDPGELMVCHRCDNRSCIKPEHLFLGTAADNNRDMRLKGRAHYAATYTHCSQGHELTPENLYVVAKTNERRCKKCAHKRMLAYTAKRREIGPRCEIEGCNRSRKTRRMCGTHYERWRKHGDPTVTLKANQQPRIEPGRASRWAS